MTKVCIVAGCGRTDRAMTRGMCSKHYQRWLHHKTTDNLGRQSRDHLIESRFWAKVNKTESCWLWTAAHARYGYFSRHCRQQYAHRVSWELANGPIPKGLFVCHKCDVMLCVRPDHLFLGTGSDNQIDCVSKGRHADRRGEKHGNSKLTNEIVIQIRARALRGETRKELSRIYGVSKSLIYLVASRRVWKHI